MHDLVVQPRYVHDAAKCCVEIFSDLFDKTIVGNVSITTCSSIHACHASRIGRTRGRVILL